MSKTNVLKIIRFSLGFLFVSLNHLSTANDDCLLPPLPWQGYTILSGGELLTYTDYDDSTPVFIDNFNYINYFCYEGFELQGEQEVRCFDGQLTAKPPLCMQTECNDPPTIKNAYYEAGEPERPYSHKKYLKPLCMDGFRKKKGSPNRMRCKRVGLQLVWTRAPVCEAIPNCGDPGYPQNCSRVADSFFAGGVVGFVCDPNFRMIGSNIISCLEDGTWSSPTPICEEIANCGDPGTPISGIRYGDSFFDGDEVFFACGVKVDELIGNSTITCQSDGLWSSDRPRCKPPSACSDPPQEDHIIYTSSNRTRDFYIPGDEVVVSCETGYTLDSDYDRNYCIEKTKDPEDYEYYYEINLETPEIVGPFWKEQFLQCKEITCQYPKTPNYGFIHELRNSQQPIEQTFPYGYTLNYGCLKGYQLIGAQFSSCLEGGWTPSNGAVKCRKITCPAVNVLDNGYFRPISESNQFIGDIVEFGCFPGFNLTGSKTRECLENGQWSGDLPKCVGNTYCPDPGTPLRGYKIGNNYSRGSVVDFACKSEDTLVGSKSRECLANGTWSGTEVSCKKYTDFDRPLEMQFRLLSHLDSSVLLTDSMTAEKENPIPTELRKLPPSKKSRPVGRMIDLSYKKGNLVLYFIFDSSTSVGPKSFNLSVDFVKALVERIKVSANGVRVGGAAFSKNIHNDQGFLPVDYTTTADVIEAMDRLKLNKFKGGGTNIHGALVNFEETIYPFLSQTLKDHKTHIFLLTDGNYNTGGDPTNLAKAMKKRGIEFSCVAVSGNKGTNMDVINNIASQPKNIYNLKDYDDMRWIVEEVLSKKVDYSRCGLAVESKTNLRKAHGRILGGNITETYWPWMAMLTGFDERSQNYDGFCGGTLIDRQWILTAAHCMFSDNGQKRRADNEIQVRLGYTKGDNHNNTQTITSKRLFIHEAFSHDTYNADVALIMLEHSADYERRVRPVCLSPADKDIPRESTLYAEKSAGWTIGYGNFQNEEVNQNEVFRDLREVALDIASDKNCEKVLKDYGLEGKYTDKVFCAGGTKGKDTCKGDSGGPFMKQQYLPDGDGYWTQTGIVSFSPFEKCGLDGVYGYYTKVSAVREWIDKIMSTH